MTQGRAHVAKRLNGHKTMSIGVNHCSGRGHQEPGVNRFLQPFGTRLLMMQLGGGARVGLAEP